MSLCVTSSLKQYIYRWNHSFQFYETVQLRAQFSSFVYLTTRFELHCSCHHPAESNTVITWRVVYVLSLILLSILSHKLKLLLRKTNELHHGLSVCVSVWTHVYYFFIYSLFNDAFSSSHYIASNEMMVHGWWIGEDVKGSGRGLIQGTFPAFA
jgi:hypothetical protein